MITHQQYGIKKTVVSYLIIIAVTLIVTLASVFTFTFTLARFFKGMTSAFVFLIIPLMYLGVYLYIDKKTKDKFSSLPKSIQFRVVLAKHIMVYIIIILTMFFLFLMTLYFPLEKRGINNSPIILNIQPYLLGVSELDYDQNKMSDVSNAIYSKYNLSLHIKSPIPLNIETNDSLISSIMFSQNCTTINYIYNLTNYSDNKTVKLVLLNYNGSVNGMASICGKGDLAFVSINSSMIGWVLSHELGHVLNAKKECWKYNLMKEYSFEECSKANWVTHDFIRDFQPDFLNQKQIDVITESVRNRFS